MDTVDDSRNRTAPLFVPPGHFYSPIVDVEDVRSRFANLQIPPRLPGISIDDERHLALWHTLLPHIRAVPFPAHKTEPFRYYFENPNFSYADAAVLHAMLAHFKPRRVIEVGSGYSSACLVDTIDLCLGGAVGVTFIEPSLALLRGLIGAANLKRFTVHEQPVQHIGPEVFRQLTDGDFLFIDSTHVMKTGSDVCHELFTVLPALAPGVFVHFHDIFWPFEYPADWVLRDNRSWNEIYALRSFLMYNDAFEVVFFNDYFAQTFRSAIESGWPAMLKNTGGSIWLRRRPLARIVHHE